MSIESEINKLHLKLNANGMMPKGSYRRNTGHYIVHQYVNCIIGLYISKNYDVIPVFIKRLTKFLSSTEHDKQHIFYSNVSDYIALMKRFINDQELSESSRKILAEINNTL